MVVVSRNSRTSSIRRRGNTSSGGILHQIRWIDGKEEGGGSGGVQAGAEKQAAAAAALVGVGQQQGASETGAGGAPSASALALALALAALELHVMDMAAARLEKGAAAANKSTDAGGTSNPSDMFVNTATTTTDNDNNKPSLSTRKSSSNNNNKSKRGWLPPEDDQEVQTAQQRQARPKCPCPCPRPKLKPNCLICPPVQSPTRYWSSISTPPEVFMCAWNPIYTNLIATGSGDALARIIFGKWLVRMPRLVLTQVQLERESQQGNASQWVVRWCRPYLASTSYRCPPSHPPQSPGPHL